jgi:bifunctional non-homologous end joining protein LigD
MPPKELTPAARVQPRFIEPMQVSPVRQLPDGGAWTYEAKLDGYRCLAAKRAGNVVLWSRRGNGFTARFPAIARACEKLPVDTLIDGEVIVVDHTGKVSFNGLQHKRQNGHVQFYAFDVLVHRGRNVFRLPIEERRHLLTEALRKVQYPVIQSTPFDVKPAELIRAAMELQLEGVIAKRKGSLYEPGRRTGAWVKYKINRSQEFVIGGYTSGNPFDALIAGCYEGKELKFVAKVRNGFVPHMRCALFPILQEFITNECPFTNLPEKRRGQWALNLTNGEMQNCQWLKPELVAQIEFNEWTPDRHLRHASFAGLRGDKEPRRIVRE